MSTPDTALQLHSVVRGDGQLEIRLDDVAIPALTERQVLVRVEAAPINPSDLMLLLGGADLTQATVEGPADRPVLRAPLPAASVTAAAKRLDEPMPVGNEGAGTVVAAGASEAAQALLGRVVAFAGGGSYADYRVVDAGGCLVFPAGITAAQGAASFVNPMTVLGMVETMRIEGHTAIVHTAAASNLGQMLNRVCLADGIPLVNIVRSPAQAQLLRDAGATHVCDSSLDSFDADLVSAITATSATLAFDAIGGGSMAGRLLDAMEAVASAGSDYSRYGSSVFKQVYIYGSLDRGPTVLDRSFGFTWGLGGWLLTPFLQKLGREGIVRFRQRIADEVTTTFASGYTDTVTLAGALQLDAARSYSRQATGTKYLITPHG